MIVEAVIAMMLEVIAQGSQERRSGWSPAQVVRVCLEILWLRCSSTIISPEVHHQLLLIATLSDSILRPIQKLVEWGSADLRHRLVVPRVPRRPTVLLGG